MPQARLTPRRRAGHTHGVRGSPLLAVALLVVLVVGCAGGERSPKPAAPGPATGAQPGVQLIPVSVSSLPDWHRDRVREALPALQRSCARIQKQPAATPIGPEARFGTAGQWQAACAAFNRVEPSDNNVRRLLEEMFVAYRVTSDGSEAGLFTGYYEPLLRGSWQRNSRYYAPLYRQPPGGVQPSRAEIAAGALRGRGLELLWVDDEIDAFFLEIQGSGRVQMDDGRIVRVGYAGKNGHPYFPIGRELIRRGEIAPEAMSMQEIRRWLKANPGQATQVMHMNASHVFFRILDGDGPIGAQGVALTAGRSLAVDPSYVPYGTPVWLDTSDPLQPGSPVRRLMVAQDTGGAIKGPIRGDVFWGFGEQAEARAGLMKQSGRWFLLLPRAAAG